VDDLARPLPIVVRNIQAVTERHAYLLEAARSGSADRSALDELAQCDAEIWAFDDMCKRMRRMHLMSFGLRWGDALRHPVHPGQAALVRTGDRVELNGVEMTIVEATRAISVAAGRGAAVAEWAHNDRRMGDPLPTETDHQSKQASFL